MLRKTQAQLRPLAALCSGSSVSFSFPGFLSVQGISLPSLMQPAGWSPRNFGWWKESRQKAASQVRSECGAWGWVGGVPSSRRLQASLSPPTPEAAPFSGPWDWNGSRSDLVSGGGRQDSRESTCEVPRCETLMERLTREILVCPLTGTAREEAEQLQKVLEPQEVEPRPVKVAQRQSVIREPAQDRGAAGEALTVPVMPATPRQGQGRKRPHPEDVGERDPSCVSSASSCQPCQVKKGPPAASRRRGALTKQDRGACVVSCSAAVEPGSSRGKPYACSECGETFAWISHFIDHLQSHSGRKLYQCQGCWKTFHFSLALAEHQKTHEKEKGYGLGGTVGPYLAAGGARAGGRMGRLSAYMEGVPSEARR